MDIPLVPFAATVLAASTPLLLAATGELAVERSGVLNLGLEGMMLAGAATAFAAAVGGAPLPAAAAAGAAAGVGLSLVFAALALGLRASQVAAGLALSILGSGLASLVGAAHVGRAIEPAPRARVPEAALEAAPALALLEQDAFALLAPALLLGVWIVLFRTRAGLALRAVGESHSAAHALGLPVLRIRLAAVAFGGACSGLAGACVSLSYTPMWSPGLTAGRGWIALALVVFSAWRPGRLLLGTLFFGSVSVLELYGQGSGSPVPPQVLSMTPYLATVAALAILSSRPRARSGAPGSLGRVFAPES